MEKPIKSRTNRFFTGLISGYAALGVNIAYTLVSIPLALRYLSKQEFGLWSLITQLAGYLLLIELGMSGSIARHLSIYKDDINGGEYGSVLMTGFYIFLIQSVIILLVGIPVVMSVPYWIEVPSHMVPSFQIVGVTQVITGSLALALRSFGSALWPQQRLEINNFASIISLVASFATLWAGFACGWGIFSLTAAAVVGFILGQLIILTACHRLHLFPKRGCWGGYDRKLFQEMLKFGSGLFVLNLGMQLVTASQTIIISRTLGLENTSVWTVAPKLSSMIQLFVNRIFETSAAGLLEMKVRGEILTLRARSSDLITLTCVIAGIGAAGLAFFNTTFLEFWTQGKIRWAPANDYLLGAVVLASCSARFHTGLASLGKDVHKVKYVCLLEGVTFVALSLLFARKFGLAGILVSSLISGIFVNLLLTLHINSQRLGATFSQILGWMWKPWTLTAILLFIHYLIVPPAARNTHVLLDFAAQIAIFIAFILPAYWYLGIPSALRQELGAMIFKVIARFKAMRPTVR